MPTLFHTYRISTCLWLEAAKPINRILQKLQSKLKPIRLSLTVYLTMSSTKRAAIRGIIHAATAMDTVMDMATATVMVMVRVMAMELRADKKMRRLNTSSIIRTIKIYKEVSKQKIII